MSPVCGILFGRHAHFQILSLLISDYDFASEHGKCFPVPFLPDHIIIHPFSPQDEGYDGSQDEEHDGSQDEGHDGSQDERRPD